jgi:hypothetical protein
LAQPYKWLNRMKWQISWCKQYRTKIWV